MKKLSMMLTLFTMLFSVTYGQTGSESIEMKKILGGYQYYQDGNRLTMGQLVKALESNEQSYKEIKQAQSNNTLASIIGGAGGFMVGWQLGAAASGGKANWTMAGIGAGLVVVSLPISAKVNKQARSAVDNFNNGLKPSAFWDRSELRLSATANGVGLVLRF